MSQRRKKTEEGLLHLPVGVKSIVCLDLKLAELFGGNGTVCEGWLVLVGVRGAKGGKNREMYENK